MSDSPKIHMNPMPTAENEKMSALEARVHSLEKSMAKMISIFEAARAEQAQSNAQ